MAASPDELSTLRAEIALLRSQLAALRARPPELDVLVVWNGEDGGPRVRALAPADLRPATEAALGAVWDYRPERDNPYAPGARPAAYLPGERRPCATLFRVRVQATAEEVESGEPELDAGMTRYNLPDC